MSASLMNDYMPNSTKRAIKEFAEQVSQRIGALEDRISEERILEQVKSEDFIEVFKRCLWVVTNTNRDMKLKAAAALLVGMLKSDTDERLSFEDTDFFIRCLDDLSIEAMKLLCEAERQTIGKRANQMNLNFDRLGSHIENEDLRMGLLHELSRFNLVQVTPASVTLEARPYSNYGIRLTRLGKEFVTRALSDPESLKPSQNESENRNN